MTPQISKLSPICFRIGSTILGFIVACALPSLGQTATPITPSLTFNTIPVGTASAQVFDVHFTLTGLKSGQTPLMTLSGNGNPGSNFELGSTYVCNPTSATTDDCHVTAQFKPSYPGSHKNAVWLAVLDNGKFVYLASTTLFGIAQGPFALSGTGTVTHYNFPSEYIYQSVTDDEGNAYIYDHGPNTITRINPYGVRTTWPINLLSRPTAPFEIAIDGNTTLYFTNNVYGQFVNTYNPLTGQNGSISFPLPAPNDPCQVQNQSPAGYQLEYLTGVALDNSDNLFALDINCNQILRRTRAGAFTTSEITPSMSQPFELATDDSGNLFVSGYDINKITPGGVQTQVNTTGAGDGLATDAAGSLYATRYNSGIGSQSGVAILAAVDYSQPVDTIEPGQEPLGVSVARDGTVWVGNYNNLDKVDRSQTTVTIPNPVIGVKSAAATTSIYNGGNEALNISNIALAGTGFALATPATSPCTVGTPVAPGAVCNLAITATLPHGGDYTGTINITSDSLNTVAARKMINLKASVTGSWLITSSSSVTFADQPKNSTSIVRTVTVKNVGNWQTGAVSGFTSSNPAFAISAQTCSSGVAAGATCTLSLTFTPTAIQAYSGTVSFGAYQYGSGSNPQIIAVALKGNGIAGSAAATLTPATVTLASTIVGNTSAALTATLTSTGSTNLSGITPSIAGANPSDFAISPASTCTATLAPATSCTFAVTFSPKAAGLRSATLVVTDNGSSSTQSIALKGTGYPSAPVITPVSGTYTSNPTISISDSTPSVVIYYTTNGTTPTAASTVYNGTFPVSVSGTRVQAVAIYGGTLKSSVTLVNIALKVATPAYSLPTGTYPAPKTISITTATPGAAIYYTTDGTIPTAASTLYSGPVTLTTTGSKTLRAIGFLAGYGNSSVSSTAYTLK